MTHHDLILFFLQICVMLTAAIIFGQAMRLLRQPAVLGELIGGMVLGPTVFGALAPQSYTWLFPSQHVTSLGREAVIKIGMLFFLFAAGLEVDLAHVRRKGLSVALTAILGSLVPFALGLGSVLFLPHLWGPQAHGRELIFALFVGTALSISALPIIARILTDLDIIHRETGVVVMTAATINDLIGWSLFAIILGSLAPGSHKGPWTILGLILAVCAVILVVGRWLGPRILRIARSSFTWPRGFIGVTAVLILAAATLAEGMGIDAIFGAFLVGIALGEGLKCREEGDLHKYIHQFAVSFFAPLYFVSVGLKANYATHFDLGLVLLVLFIACVGKIGGAGLGAWIGGMGRREALAVGFGMNARGAMEIILASVALEYRLIDQRIFVALVVMALVTSMLSGPSMGRLTRDSRKGRDLASGTMDQATPPQTQVCNE